jgi:hypothetical protein
MRLLAGSGIKDYGNTGNQAESPQLPKKEKGLVLFLGYFMVTNPENVLTV